MNKFGLTVVFFSLIFPTVIQFNVLLNYLLFSGKGRSLLEWDEGCRLVWNYWSFVFSRETFGRMNVDRQSIFLPVPGSLRNWAEIYIKHVNTEELKFLKINPNLQFVVKPGGLGNRMRGYELGTLFAVLWWGSIVVSIAAYQACCYRS
jgi:hypothetical protein